MRIDAGELAKVAVTGAAAAAIATASAVGFSSPRQSLEALNVAHEKRFSVIEQRQEKVELKQGEMDQTLARMDQKLDDMMAGLGIPSRGKRNGR